MCSGHSHFFAPYDILLCLKDGLGAATPTCKQLFQILQTHSVKCDATTASDIKQNIFGGVPGKVPKREGRDSRGPGPLDFPCHFLLHGTWS